jgi:hypothetical protein
MQNLLVGQETTTPATRVLAVHLALAPADGSVVVNVAGVLRPVLLPSATHSELDGQEITGWASGTGVKPGPTFQLADAPAPGFVELTVWYFTARPGSE